MPEGFLITIPRDAAKQLFSLREPEPVAELLRSRISDEQLLASGDVVSLGNSWEALHGMLTGGSTDPAAGEYPFNHVVLGGRPLPADDDTVARLLRPDMPPHIVDALGKVDSATLEDGFSNLPTDVATGHTCESLQQTLETAKTFYAKAAEGRHATVFFANSD